MRYKIVLILCAVLFASLARAEGYQAVRIDVPEPKSTVHDNGGNLAVTVSVLPPLRAEAGDHLVLLLDGKEVASGTALSFNLTDIDRGSHTLRARVQASDNKVLATSSRVRFYMWRASRLFRKNTK